MAIPLNDNLQINANKPVDKRYFQPNNTPWDSVAQVKAGILLTERFSGLTVRILTEEYWFHPTTADADLKLKSFEIEAPSSDPSKKYYSGLKTWIDFATTALNSTLGIYVKAVPILLPTPIPIAPIDVNDTIRTAIQKLDGQLDNRYTKSQVDSKLEFTTQTIATGGNYNNLEITADLVVFTNEDAQAIINGVWGKKDFHVLNLSTKYEIRINNSSTSISGKGQAIKLPTIGGNMGIKGTARILQTAGYGYFVADTWGSKYRPEHIGLTETELQTVNENSVAGTMKTVEFMIFRDAQTVAMTKADLNASYSLYSRPLQIVCPALNLIYVKTSDDTNNWHSLPLTPIV